MAEVREIPPKKPLDYLIDLVTRQQQLEEATLKVMMEMRDYLRVLTGKPPVAPVVLPAPPAPPELVPLATRLDISIDELREIKERLAPILKRANDYEVISLSFDTAETLKEYLVEGGVALTVFKCNGTFDLRFNEKTAHSITVESITYPDMLTFPWFDFDKLYLTWTAQSGKSATLIVWKHV